jgi:predicted DNA-binding transcriptional regulator AlpA
MTTKAAIGRRFPLRRGLDEREAALYLSLSPSFFRRLVVTRSIPKPRVIGSRRIWDIDELDRWFMDLPRQNDNPAADDGTAQIEDSWADYR